MVLIFKHIPAFQKAVSEAYQVLKQGAYFLNYSLINQAHITCIKGLFGKGYQASSWINCGFLLIRASEELKIDKW